MTSGFSKLGEEELFAGKVFRLVRSTFRGPDGGEFERHIVQHPGAVAVVPLHDDGTVSLVRQYRVALEHDLLEVPAGTRDVVGEDERVTAARELTEEAGLAAGSMEHLITFFNAPGISDESISLFLARHLTEVDHDRQSEEEHAMTVERFPLDLALEMIENGRITDAKTIIGLTLTARRR
ncbi:MAG: NUDIX hydrolase [Acidimicrobiales bacterium]